MSFPFSIFGIIIYLVYVSAVLGIFVLPLWKLLLKGKAWKWWLITPIAILLLISPIIEELWITYHFNTLCENTGVQIERVVEAAGYYDETKNDSSTTNKTYNDPRAVERLQKSGFRFIERRTRQGRVRHLEIINGKIEQRILDKPQARYYYKYSHNNQDIEWKIKKIQRIVIDSKNGEIIGRTTIIKRYPGWLEHLWIQFIGSGMQMCPIPDEAPFQPAFPEAVLIPSKL